MKKIVIFGIGETAHLAYEYFTHDPNYTDHKVIAFSVDNEYLQEKEYLGLPVVAMEEVTNLYPPSEYFGFVAVASGHLNRDRAVLYKRAKSLGYQMISYVSARAFVWHNVEIGENCFILENNTLQPFSKIGNNVVLWSGNHIGHRSEIKDHCFLTSHVVVSGFCTVGEFSFIGVNSALADNVNVARNNFIGMGTSINKDTIEDGFYAGNSAELKKISAKRFCKVKEE